VTKVELQCRNCATAMTLHLSNQGSQALLGDFDQLVEGSQAISTSCPPGGLWRAANAFWREKWSKHPPVSGPKFRSAGRRPFHSFRNFGPSAVNFDPSTSLRALSVTQVGWLSRFAHYCCATPRLNCSRYEAHTCRATHDVRVTNTCDMHMTPPVMASLRGVQVHVNMKQHSSKASLEACM
jgi:hypothetical protein